jgi:hypothetical protein
MQTEMGLVMGSVSRDFDTPGDNDKTPNTESDPPSAEETALVERADRATGCQLAERVAGPRRSWDWRKLALNEVRVMKGYRPRLLRAGTAAAGVRAGVFRILAQTEGLDRGTPLSEKDVFWDEIV